ncbi:MAG TPA: tagaturonate epimerase family protein [archaeon]|nr:tagaturonate epimerase family protein [archaeon]
MSDKMEGRPAKVGMEELAGKLGAALSKGAPGIAGLDGVYPESVKYSEGAFIFMVRTEQGKRLALAGNAEVAGRFTGETLSGVKFCPLRTENAEALRETFPWTAPVPIGRRASFGAGDRLGLATPGHLRALSRFEIFPVLAQQSMRELGRTGRTPQAVIDDAGWGAFQNGYTGSFAADADHIKKVEEAIDCYLLGFTMFTVDASDYIDLQAVNLPDEQALEQFKKMPEYQEIRARYRGKTWSFAGNGLQLEIAFSEAEIARSALVYHKAIEHMALIYRGLKAAVGNRVEGFDLEVSVDETETDTTERDHVFWATELKARGMMWQSLAPKFTGQFQKGIDYIGDREKFERQFASHALIAQKLGPYKISVHSGSDKFSIFPVIGRQTAGYFHLKTAGTSWLEAVRVIALRNPRLYRWMHDFALLRFEADRASYHVTTNLEAIPQVDSLQDSELPGLMDEVDSRQLLHITYGSLLSSRDEASGRYLFRDEIYSTLYDYEETYYEMLDRHIGRHLETLGVRGR